MGLSKALRDVLWGNPFGSVLPKREAPVSVTADGRTAALTVLARYISELTFYRPGGLDVNGNTKDPIPFQIAERDVHVEEPDDEEEYRVPAIALLAQAPANYDAIGMTSKVLEETKDVYGEGTVLIWMSEHQENFVLEIRAETKQQRRAMVLGLENALSPIEQMAGIRFLMNDYYGQLCTFQLQSKEYIDDDMDLLARRKAKLVIQLVYNVVALFPVNELVPAIDVLVDADDSTGDPIADPQETNELGAERSRDIGQLEPRSPDQKKNPGPGL